MVGLTKQEVEAIVSTEMDKMKASLMERLTELMDAKFKSINEDMKKINEKIQQNYDALMARITALESDKNELKKLHAKDVVALLDLEIHSRKRNLIITNIEESTNPDNETTDHLLAKFKTILKDSVKMNPTYVDSFTFTAAHRLGGKKDSNHPRSTIIVFDRSHHIQDMWKLVKKLGGTCKYNFKTHLPTDIARYKSELLRERIQMRGGDSTLGVRVVEIKGYPQMEVKNRAGKWDIIKAYKDRFNDLLE